MDEDSGVGLRNLGRTRRGAWAQLKVRPRLKTGGEGDGRWGGFLTRVGLGYGEEAKSKGRIRAGIVRVEVTIRIRDLSARVGKLRRWVVAIRE